MDYTYDFENSDYTTYDGATAYQQDNTYDNLDDFGDFDGSSFVGGALGGAIVAVIMTYFAVIAFVALFMVITQWIVYKKANKPGWATLIPIYSQWVLFEAVGMPGWYSLLALIPFVGSIIVLVFYIMALVKLSNCFGKEGGFAVGLILLPIVFFPILAFGKATFTPPVTETNNN